MDFNVPDTALKVNMETKEATVQLVLDDINNRIKQESRHDLKDTRNSAAGTNFGIKSTNWNLMKLDSCWMIPISRQVVRIVSGWTVQQRIEDAMRFRMKLIR